jgi:hypothetical protein
MSSFLSGFLIFLALLAVPLPAQTADPAVPPAKSGEPAKALTALPAATVPASPQEALNRALIAYNAGAWEQAKRELLDIVETGQLSPALAHNLGNAEFRLGNSGQAVLWYRRALALQPLSPETWQNLRAIRRQSAFLSFDSWLLSFSYLKPRWIYSGTALLSWLTGLLLVWLVWLTPAVGRRWPLVTLICLTLPLLLCGLALTWRTASDPAPLASRQIVSGKDTVACAAPAEASATIIPLPAGSEVVPLETRGNWIYCLIPGSADDLPLRGWVRSAKLEPLWPWPALF